MEEINTPGVDWCKVSNGKCVWQGTFFFFFFKDTVDLGDDGAEANNSGTESVCKVGFGGWGEGGDRRSCEQALRPRRGCVAKTSQKKERKVSKDYVNI